MKDHDRSGRKQSLTSLTADVVSAYVSKNTITTSQIGQLIGDIGRRLREIEKPQAEEPAKPGPAVPVRRSIGSNHLICLVCGKKQRMLKRHLAIQHQLTPDEYRRLFDLKLDYPMVAPNYGEMRRDLALKIGLGRPKEQTPTKHIPSKPAPAMNDPAERAAAPKAEPAVKTRRAKAKAARGQVRPAQRFPTT